MKLHGIGADTLPARDRRIAESVPHGVRDAPLGWRQQITVGWTSPGPFRSHVCHLISLETEFPYPGPILP